MSKYSFHSQGKLFIISAVIILLIFFHYLKITKPVENVLFLLSRDFGRVVYNNTLKVSNFFELIFSIRSLQKQNGSLIEKNLILVSENNKLQEFKKENEELKQELKLKSKKNFELLGADIIGRNSDGLRQSLILDQGSKNGVFENAVVIFGDGYLIGRVIEISPYTSKVLLITDPDSVVNSLVLETEATGNISGQHGIGFFMDMIPQTEVIKVGDKVASSGLSGDFPQGLLIGEISQVENNSGSLFQKAQVRPFVNFSKLFHVFIITNFNSGVIL